MTHKSLTVVMVLAFSVMFQAERVDAGSVVIPGWAFTHGNVRIDADPSGLADAGPIAVSGSKQPWGWVVKYEIDVPVEANYTLQVCYASPDPRPMTVRIDSSTVGVMGYGATFDPANVPAGKSSCARWERLTSRGKPVKLWDKAPLSKGKHTVIFKRRQELPNIVAVRLDTDTEFPADWRAPQYAVRDLDSIPAEHRKVFQTAAGPRLDLPPALEIEERETQGTLDIPAWTFDRGNARIYASPDQYALSSPLVGDGAGPGEEGVIEYDIEFPIAAEYTLHIRYAAVELRPVDVFLDGRRLGRSCIGHSLNTAAFVRPHEYPVSSRSTRTESLYANGKLLKLSIPAGKHTVKLARRGPLPHLASLKFETESAFPKDWQQPERKVDLSRVAPEHRGVFLPPGSVNVAAMRLAVAETAMTFGAQYAAGQSYLKRLDEAEAVLKAAEDGGPEELQHAFDTSAALRREVMQAHPLLDFDKLLFLKRPSEGYGHTYSDQHQKVEGGSLCVLSPVSPDGKVTSLVPELDGGLFDRFDLSFDAKKVVFSYRKKEEPFRLYEVDIDPAAGTMIPGSLRQLTFGGEAEKDALKRQVGSSARRFQDMDPCYLPNGKIMFVSTRAERIVFCHPSTVTTLYLMDADGGNLHRLSESPVNETAPSMLPDGRVIYTRWEYLDKALAFAQSLWAMRPDGTGSDHVYKNNTQWPAGMSSARAIPGSERIVTIAGNHHFTAVGPVVLVDWRKSRDASESMTCITPGGGYPGVYNYPQPKFGTFMDPYPLSEDFYIVSHTPGVSRGQQRKPYGLFMLDRWGNRAELYQDPEISCFEPMPLVPRSKPASIVGVTPRDKGSKKMTGSLFLQDVYQGMPGIERGRVKYLRVMGALEWPWDQNGISWSLGADPHRKKIYGIVKVHEDGSAYFTVPANENVFFQALDKDFMALQEMSSYINLMPGERRACIGCHEKRRKAPTVASSLPMAMDYPAQIPVPQPGETGPRVVDFSADIQPILDEHCVKCHSGPKPKGRLDFVNAPSGKFSRSYDSLKASGTICYRGGGKAGIRSTPPLTHGSRASRLPAMLLKGHGKTKLSREEFVRFVTWIDANIPYYGTYGAAGALKTRMIPTIEHCP